MMETDAGKKYNPAILEILRKFTDSCGEQDWKKV